MYSNENINFNERIMLPGREHVRIALISGRIQATNVRVRMVTNRRSMRTKAGHYQQGSLSMCEEFLIEEYNVLPLSVIDGRSPLP